MRVEKKAEKRDVDDCRRKEGGKESEEKTAQLTRHEDDIVVRQALAAGGFLEDRLGGKAVRSILLNNGRLVARV